MQTFVGFEGGAVQPSAQIKRVEMDGDVYVSLNDMVYLTEASRERHLIQGSVEKAGAMENFGFVLGMMLRT